MRYFGKWPSLVGAFLALGIIAFAGCSGGQYPSPLPNAPDSLQRSNSLQSSVKAQTPTASLAPTSPFPLYSGKVDFVLTSSTITNSKGVSKTTNYLHPDDFLPAYVYAGESVTVPLPCNGCNNYIPNSVVNWTISPATSPLSGLSYGLEYTFSYAPNGNGVNIVDNLCIPYGAPSQSVRLYISDGGTTPTGVETSSSYLTINLGGSISCSTPAPKPTSPGTKLFSVAMPLFRTFDTSAGPRCQDDPRPGSCACAWLLNQLLVKAGLKPLGVDGNYVGVSAVEYALTKGGRGSSPEPIAATMPGDIVIEGDDGHVGICATAKCTTAWSNSSSQHMFGWASGPNLGEDSDNGYALPVTSRIYRLLN